jgi:TolA-binding protein
VPASVLAAQNDLFLSAVRARRAGQNARALALFERFMRDYPDASLFESALVHKMRLLAATSDFAAASASARQYLARFPDGFARDEARALLGTRARP